jgi:GNAT superfamily N-acetyltransferase
VSDRVVLARPEDLAALPAIERAAAALLDGHAPRAVLEETTDLPTFEEARAAGRLWVALADDVPVGFAHVVRLADGTPHLEELDVHPAHGRRGLGAALVRAACAWTAAHGHAQLTLTTFRALRWNMPFYERLGFREIAPDRLSPALAAVVAGETARGLDPARRAVLAWPIASP